MSVMILPLIIRKVSSSRYSRALSKAPAVPRIVGFFERVIDMHAETRAVAERFHHRFGLMMQVDDEFTKTEFGDIFGDIADQRLAQKWNRRFGAVNR